MRIPEGKTEQEILDIVKKIARKLEKIFKFGYFTLEDIEQQCILYTIKALDKYDNVRPLENFLYIALHNELYNLKRNKFERPNKPCLNCPLNAYDPHGAKSKSGCLEFANKTDCEPYAKWYFRNLPKKSLMSPAALDDCDENTIAREQVEDIDSKVLFQIIDDNIPMDMRADYIKIKHGVKITKKRNEEIVIKIREILTEHGYSEEGWGTIE